MTQVVQREPTPPENVEQRDPTPPENAEAPPTDDTEYSPVDRYDDPRDKNLCRHCPTMIKMTTGRRTCTHYCTSKGYAIAADPDQSILAITDKDDRVLAQVSYICGYENHPNRGIDDAIDEMETVMLLTNTHILPEEESSTEGAEDTASSGHVDSDNPDDSDPDVPPGIPRYQVLHEAPTESTLESTIPGSPQPGPSGTQQEQPEAQPGDPEEESQETPKTPCPLHNGP